MRNKHHAPQAAPARRKQTRRSRPEVGLGLRFYRRWVLVRRPIYIAINIARRPSLSIRLVRGTLNVNTQGVAMRVAPAPGWAYRRQLFRWPWTRTRLERDQEPEE